MATFPPEDSTRGFPLPAISEDTLHYTLHLPPSGCPDTNSTQADAAALATMITTYVQSLLMHPWLWNKDAWELKVESSAKLAGTMRVGDAVDDEWLVVWLLREVSRRWTELVISIRDTDGEFLLIEAANELPDWVSPENAENRLWLSGGHLHLLPLSIRSAASSRPKQLADDLYDDAGRAFDPNAWVSEPDALAAIRTGKFRADARMENAVWERISCYPAALKTHQQRAMAYLPVPVARALRSSPDLIQRAIEGFYVRDPAQLRAASRMIHFPPEPAVLSSVVMTRAAYAQLQGQVFNPPRVFGPEWHVPEGQENDDERRWRDLGVKIATGFEIMYREGGRKGRMADIEASVDDLRLDPTYQKYIADLKKAGFFGGELEGSAEWKKREVEATKGWVKARSSDTTQQRQSFAYQVDNAIEQSNTVPVSDLTAAKESPEDNDSWLEVSPEQVDAMLRTRTGARRADPSAETAEFGDDEQGRTLQELASKVQEFVGGQGDLEGARFADELSDEDMNSGSDDDDDNEPTEEERKERLANLVPSLPAEEWGRKTQKQPAQSDVEMASNVQSSHSKGIVAGSELGDSMLPPKMRPPIFAKQEFDGVVSESSDEEDDLPAPGTLGRKIAQMKWGEGAPPREARIEAISDEDDAEDKADRARAKDLKFDDNDLDELMRQRVWGDGDNAEDNDDGDDEDMDVDMDNEQEDFLKFSREALGISDQLWDNIIKSRQERGAFVPETKRGGKVVKKPQPRTEMAAETSAAPTTAPAPAPNQSLNSFESMMTAMEAELARAKEEQSVSSTETPAAPLKVQFKKPSGSSSSASNPPDTKARTDGKGEGKKGKKGKKAKSKFTSLSTLPSEADLDTMDELAAMDAELRAALANAGEDDLEDGDMPDAAGLGPEQQRDYRMMRDLLESASQGHGGAANALLSRLGEDIGKK